MSARIGIVRHFKGIEEELAEFRRRQQPTRSIEDDLADFRAKQNKPGFLSRAGSMMLEGARQSIMHPITNIVDPTINAFKMIAAAGSDIDSPPPVTGLAPKGFQQSQPSSLETVQGTMTPEQLRAATVATGAMALTPLGVGASALATRLGAGPFLAGSAGATAVGSATAAAANPSDPFASALAGGATAALLHGGGTAAGKIAGKVKNLLPRPKESGSVAGKVAGAAGLSSHADVALQDLMTDIRRSGITPEEYINRAQTFPDAPLYDLGPSMNKSLGSPVTKRNPAGDPLVRRARGLQSITSKGSADLSEFTNTRAEQRPASVKKAVETGLGVGRENTVKLGESLEQARSTQAAKDYGPLRDLVVDDPEALALFDEPEFRSLHKFVQDEARLRGEPAIPALKSTQEVSAKPTLADFEQRWPDVSHSVHEKDGVIRLDKIVVPQSGRGKGIGTAFMNDLTAYADATGQRIALSPSKDFGASSIKRLDEFYKQFGFKPNAGRSKDFAISETRVREPSGAIAASAPTEVPEALNPQTLGTLDKMKRFADDIVAGKIEGGAINRSQARAMSARLKAIRARLDELHPEYAEARSNFAHGSGNIDAAEAGKSFLGTSGDQLEVDWASYSPAEKQNYRKTALASIEERLGSGSGMRPEQLLNEVNARKLRIIAESPEAYTQLERSLRANVQGAANDAMIMGGSPTARIGAEQADLGASPGLVQGVMRAGIGDLGPLARLATQNALAKRLRGLTELRADNLAPYLTASGEDLIQRLQSLQLAQKALDELAKGKQARRAATAGYVGGQLGSKTP